MGRFASHLRWSVPVPYPRRRPIGIHLGGEGPPRVCIPFSYGRQNHQRRGSARVGEARSRALPVSMSFVGPAIDVENVIYIKHFNVLIVSTFTLSGLRS